MLMRTGWLLFGLCMVLAALNVAQAEPELELLGYERRGTLEETLRASLGEIQKPRLGKVMYLGPFKAKKETLDTSAAVDLDATYESEVCGTACWNPVPGETEGRWEVQRFNPAPDGPRWVSVYFFREVHAESAGWFWVNPGNRQRLFLNGEEVPGATSRHYRLKLKKGRNELLIYCRRYLASRQGPDIAHPPLVNQLCEQLTGDFGPLATEPFRSYCRLKDAEVTREEWAEEARHPEAVVREGEDPLEALLRRTGALTADLREMHNAPDLDAEVARLNELRRRAGEIEKDTHDRLLLFMEAHRLRREIALQNPLLDFDRILFLTHHYPKAHHMCDQYFGHEAVPGGSIYRLEDVWSDSPKAVDLIEGRKVKNGRLKGRELEGGSFVSLELSFDAEEVSFAYTEAGAGANWSPERTYHVFKANADGSNLSQLTDGPWNEFDPCFLPGGRIVFISERRGGFGRCHARPVPTYTLHSMLPDGSDIITLSFHETNEWHPSVTHDGKLIYTRWDYVDRDSDVAQHPWLCYPDGRDPRTYHGNYPVDRSGRPWMEMSMRAIPGSERYLGVAAPHHDQAFGSLIMLDQRVPDNDYRSQLWRVTPDTRFPEAEGHWRSYKDYGTPWPLSQDYYLAVWDPDEVHHDIYLVDAFGNKVLIYRDPNVPALDPIPLLPRQRPPILPTMTEQPVEARASGDPMPADGTVSVMNVYESDFDWPEGAQVEKLRIVQLFPKATAHQKAPRVGIGAQSLARGVFGTVPVEDDGSANVFNHPNAVNIMYLGMRAAGNADEDAIWDAFVREHYGEGLEEEIKEIIYPTGQVVAEGLCIGNAQFSSGRRLPPSGWRYKNDAENPLSWRLSWRWEAGLMEAGAIPESPMKTQYFLAQKGSDIIIAKEKAAYETQLESAEKSLAKLQVIKDRLEPGAYQLLDWLLTENILFLKTSEEMQLAWLYAKRAQNTRGHENDQPFLDAMEEHLTAIYRLEEEYNAGERPDITWRARNHTVPRGAWMNRDKFRDDWVPQLREVANSEGREEFPSGVGDVQRFPDNFPFDLIIQGSKKGAEQ